MLFKDMTASGKSLVNSVSGSLPNCYTWIGYTQANGPPRVLLSRDVDRNGTAPTRCFSQITQTLGDCKAPSRHCQSKVVIKAHVSGRAGEASGFPGRPGVQGAEPLAAS